MGWLGVSQRGETLSEVTEEDNSADQHQANTGAESKTPSGWTRQTELTIWRLANSCAASSDDQEVVLKKYPNTEEAKMGCETQGASKRAQCALLTFSNKLTGETIMVSQGWG